MKSILEARLIRGYQTKASICSFCGKDIPVERIATGAKYCSTICPKRKWQVDNKSKTSRFIEESEDYFRTATGIAVKWERWFVDTFGGQWMNEEIMSAPYDVKWKGKNIDVKVGKYHIRKKKRGKIWNGGGIWTFKPNAFFKPEIDFYACICLKKDKVVKVLLIPACEYQKTAGISVGHKSKWDNFKINF